MRALVLERPGRPLRLIERRRPRPKAGHVLVRIEARGLQHPRDGFGIVGRIGQFAGRSRLSRRWAMQLQAEARIAVFEFIEGFYNPRRRHSSIGYVSPIAYERRAREHDGATVVQAGTKRCSRPNKKMGPKRRTECRQTRYPDPNPDLSMKPGQARGSLSCCWFQQTQTGRLITRLQH